MNSRIYPFLLVSLMLNFSQLRAQKAFVDSITEGHTKLIIHVLGHSSVLVEYDTLKVYIDPYSKFNDFAEMPKADLILVTHGHSDHFDISAINDIKKDSTLMIYPSVCANTNTYNGKDTVLANGDSIMVKAIAVSAVPAYNLVATQHPKGVGNGYVVQFGNTRLYFSGDGEKTPEMANLRNIDVAFLGMSRPFNMTPDSIVAAALLIKPNVLVPYHYDDNDPSDLLTLMVSYPEIEVWTKETHVVNQIDVEPNQSVVLYPNPVDDYLCLSGFTGLREVAIFDLAGKLITTKTVHNSDTILINDLKPGVYLVRVDCNKKNSYLKFVKE